MLKPRLCSIELGPDIRSRIEPHVFGALFGYLKQHPPRKRKDGLPSLTVTEVKDVLQIALPQYRESIASSIRDDSEGELAPLQEIGSLVHEWLHDSIRFFRREGSAVLRQTLTEQDEHQRQEKLWGMYFSRCLIRLIQSSGVLSDPQKLESCDLAVESLRLWVGDILQKLAGVSNDRFSPRTFFLDTEGDLQGIIEWKGNSLHLRGRPDAVILNLRTGRPEVCEYKFGLQGRLELQIAQVLLYLRLINATRGVEESIDTGRLELFRIVKDADGVIPPTSEFPPAVDAAFRGYVGNHGAVRRLKIACTLALREGRPPRMPVNLMFCGPGGLGKTELARRVAAALGLPLVDVPATTVKDVDALLERVNETLRAEGLEPIESGMDSGLPRFRYPPLVIFLDEIHELRRKVDAFLNMFEPKEKRAVGEKTVGDFKDATILAATTDRGLLPEPFLTRFRMVDLAPYTTEEVAAIIQAQFQNLGQPVDQSFLIALAKRSRLNPRVALQRAEEMLEHHRFNSGEYPLTLDGLTRVSSEDWGVDENGLSRNDLLYLKALGETPRGLNALAAMLPVGKDEIVNVIEPYLLNLEVVRRTGGGREITERGRRLLK